MHKDETTRDTSAVDERGKTRNEPKAADYETLLLSPERAIVKMKSTKS